MTGVFFVTYLRRELRRRMRQTVVTALGLAIGVGLVVTVTAAAAGVRNAQADVLHSLFGIGTDITVTTTAPPPKAGAPDASAFDFTPGAAPRHLDQLGLVPGLGLLDASSVASIEQIRGVAATAGGLTLMNTTLTVPAKSDIGPDGKPPANAFPTTFTVNGVDVTHTGLGPLASGAISAGRSLTAADASARVAVVDAAYATANGLSVGSAMTIGNTGFTVVGLVRQTQGGGSANAYIPLGRAQALARFHGLDNLAGKVSTIYVAAGSAADIAGVQQSVSALLPSATVTSSANLAGAVSGSLASASDLAERMGRWLAIAALTAAFAVAGLLTMAAVARRVREFGTLKALGWRSHRIVAQLLGESLVVGVIGAVTGIAMGFGGAGLINLAAPGLSATVAQNPGATPPENVTIDGNGMHRQIAADGVHTVAVHLSAPVSGTTILLAAALAIAGGLIAGALGGWRAARLRPAEALGKVA